MRVLISVLAMLVVGLLATQAKADLVDDLRSGGSDIKAAPSNTFHVQGFVRWHKELQSKSKFTRYRAMAVQWYPPYGSWRVYGSHSAEAAVRDAVSCQRRSKISPAGRRKTRPFSGELLRTLNWTN